MRFIVLGLVVALAAIFLAPFISQLGSFIAKKFDSAWKTKIDHVDETEAQVDNEDTDKEQ